MTTELRIGIGGLGTIGSALARAVTSGRIPGQRLAAVAVRDPAKVRTVLGNPPDGLVVTDLAGLAQHADVVVECAPAEVFADVAGPAIEAGRTFMPASVGALLRRMDLVDRAAATGARIIVPTGALVGLDAVRAAAEGTIDSVRIETRKPPASLEGAPHLVANGIPVAGLSSPKLVFSGTAREGAAGFPANINVAAALGLAGVGPDRTGLQIWADPGVTRNVHTITVESDSARFTMTIENVPTEENPRTGRITAQSMIAALRRLTAPLVAGT